MKKPWIEEDGGRQLEAYLGSRGFRTSEMETTQELIQTAAGVFEIPMETSCRKMADAITAIPKSDRRKLARRNIGPGLSPRGGKFLNGLAKELGVNPAYLRQAIVAACDRIEAREKTGSASIPSRAHESGRRWNGRGA